MDALWPQPVVAINTQTAMAAESREAPDHRPWVTMMMISSLDGAAAFDGVSGPLGAPADKAVFTALRSLTDVVVVGAGTARAEDYGPIPLRSQAVQQQRQDRSQQMRPALAVISGRLQFSIDDRLFSDATARPLLYTVSALDAGRRDALAGVAEVVTAGADRVDPALVLGDLADRGHRHALLEGGPRLNADFLAADLVDEIHLSLAPLAVGAPAPRIIDGPDGTPGRGFSLNRVWLGDGLLFLRYLRSPDDRS